MLRTQMSPQSTLSDSNQHGWKQDQTETESKAALGHKFLVSFREPSGKLPVASGQFGMFVSSVAAKAPT